MLIQNKLEIKNRLEKFPSTQNEPSLDEIGDYKEIAIDHENQAIYVGAK